MTKRGFLCVLGIGAGAAVARPAAVWADRLRILGSGREPDPRVGGDTSPELQRFVRSVRVGERRAHGALSVFWLHGERAAAPLAVVTLEEARARGDLLVAERDQAVVPSLVVENRGKAHVLLLAGEILLGGKQNRVVTEDVLAPPLSGPLALPVYCVEQGRWTGETKQFMARGTFAAPSLRAKVLEGSGQREVWAEVDRYAARAAAPSPTASYQAIHDKPEVRAHQKDVAAAIDHRAAAGAQGAAVFSGETLAGLDLFQDPSLFAREWPKLLRAHAVETYGRSIGDTVDERRLRSHLGDVLRDSAVVSGSLRRSIGAGRLFEFRVDRLRGAALVAEGHVVHVAVL